jgi:hypothetical protein
MKKVLIILFLIALFVGIYLASNKPLPIDPSAFFRA